MRKIVLTLAALFLFGGVANAQYEYKFTVVKENPATPVKNQARTGTCWCFATTSLMESELLRMGKGEYDLSEMYIVRKVYEERMDDNYLRRGNGNLGPGAVSHVFLKAMGKYGLMPDVVYPGVDGGSGKHNHTALQSYVNENSKLAVEAKKRMPEALKKGILDAFLGELPASFKYEGKEYTPQSFYKKLGLNADDYVEITSFTHHPFYERVPLEIPDNFDHELFYNLPLNELMETLDYAINNGYTVAWDGDVSERSYDFAKGIALMTDADIKGTKSIKERYVETDVDQALRQKMFEDFTTTDDHLEHITGIAKDQEGVKYYKTKNSWGTERGIYEGYHYMSENYVKGKTIAIILHKNAIPKEIKKKLGIK